MFPLWIGIASAALSALSGFSQSQSQGNMQRQQAAMLKAQAQMERRQADLELQKGRQEAKQIEGKRSELRRQFEDTQAKNRSLLAAGNVDMYSGSAADVSLGNINQFAADMGENYYDKAMALWEANEKKRQLEYQANAHDANASYLSRTAANVGTSLLTGLIQGAGGFATGYSMAGGSLSSLFSSSSSNPGLPQLAATQKGFPTSKTVLSWFK